MSALPVESVRQAVRRRGIGRGSDVDGRPSINVPDEVGIPRADGRTPASRCNDVA